MTNGMKCPERLMSAFDPFETFALLRFDPKVLNYCSCLHYLSAILVTPTRCPKTFPAPAYLHTR